MQNIEFTLNGSQIEVSIDPRESLLHMLRNRLGVFGPKEGCGKGECGACTVLVEHNAVNACIFPAGKVDGLEVVTIEGLQQGEHLHPIQQAFIDTGAVQCGFCTPGMILSAKDLLDHHHKPSRQEIRRAISGNICRCTGYSKIIDAIEYASKDVSKS